MSLFFLFNGYYSVLAEKPKPPTLQNMAGGLENAGGEQGIGLNVEAYKTNDTLYTSLGLLINTAINFAGIICVLFLIYAGWLWMMAKGNEEQVGKAKKIAEAAIIALIIILCAWFIYEFLFYYLAVGQSI